MEKMEVDLTNENNNNFEKYLQKDDNLPWIEKYRPNLLKGLISHVDIISTLETFIKKKSIPHLLFYGPPGTGKTTTILAIARQIYGEKYQSNVLELNASDERGIDIVREQIKNFANSKQIFGSSSNFKIIILDEADNMTSSAQAALRRVMEAYTKNTRFCLICNYLNKIIPAIQSRCTKFRFSPLNDKDVENRLSEIALCEKLQFTKEGIIAIIKIAQGDMRKCLNILQSTYMSFENINEENIYLSTGIPAPKEIDNILELLLKESPKNCFKEIYELQNNRGLCLNDIIKELHLKIISSKMNSEIKTFIIIKLSEIEIRLSSGCSEKLNLSTLISTFYLIRSFKN